MIDINIDWFPLQAGAFRIVETDAFSPAAKEQKMIELARTDGGVNVFERFKPKSITLTGIILADDSNTLEEYIDQLNVLYGRKNLELQLGFRGGYRFWQVDFQNIIIARKNTDVSRCGFSIQLVAPKPYSTDGTSATLLSESGRTSDFSVDVNVSGTYLGIPELTLTINDIDPDDSEATLTVGNAVDERYLNITKTFKAGDIVRIDSVNKHTYVNDILVRVTGNYPAWRNGAGRFDFTSNASTIDIDIDGEYDLRWL